MSHEHDLPIIAKYKQCWFYFIFLLALLFIQGVVGRHGRQWKWKLGPQKELHLGFHREGSCFRWNLFKHLIRQNPKQFVERQTAMYQDAVKKHKKKKIKAFILTKYFVHLKMCPCANGWDTQAGRIHTSCYNILFITRSWFLERELFLERVFLKVFFLFVLMSLYWTEII